jgi:hypothetical protein
MSILFNARLNINEYNNIDSTNWTIKAQVIDNNGTFFAASAGVGNVIYINDEMDNLILRYKVTAIDPKTAGATLYATVTWDMSSDSPVDPLVECEALIGAASGSLGLTTLTSGNTNFVSEPFLNSIRNYENFQILDKAVSNITVIPTKEYVAAENIQAYKILYITDNNQVKIADCSNLDCADRIIGMSLETKATGETIKVQLDQKIENKNWSFAKTGDTVFVGTNGDYALVPDPKAKFIQEIGIIVSNNSIELNMEDATIL